MIYIVSRNNVLLQKSPWYPVKYLSFGGEYRFVFHPNLKLNGKSDDFE